MDFSFVLNNAGHSAAFHVIHVMTYLGWVRAPGRGKTFPLKACVFVCVRHKVLVKASGYVNVTAWASVLGRYGNLLEQLSDSEPI